MYIFFLKVNVFSFLLLQAIQTSFVVEELVDHALSKSQKAQTKRATSDKSLAEAEKTYKESLFRLAKAERGYKSANVTLGGAKKQAEELRVQQRKVDGQLTSAKEQIKLQLKELEGKDVEKAKAEQAAYDASMNKTVKSLTAQLRDIARAFCLKVWGEALNAVRVDANSELRGPFNVYYPPALWIAPSPSPSVSSLMPSSLMPPSFEPFSEKEKKDTIQVVEVESKEVEAEEKPKGKGKGKEKKTAKQTC